MRLAANPARLLSFSPRKAGFRLELAFTAVQRFLARINPAFRFIRLRTDCQVIPKERRERKSGARNFMHTGHWTGAVCSFPGADQVGEGYLFGLLLHEFGHLGAGMELGERAADQWILDRTGIRIQYLGELDLQWVDQWAIRRILQGFTPPRRNPRRRPRPRGVPTRPRP